jgi:hypothetical protein
MGHPDVEDAKPTGTAKHKSLGDRPMMALLGMIHGYWISQVVRAAADLRLADLYPPTDGYPHRVPPGDRGSKTAHCAAVDPRSRRAPIPGAVSYPNGGNVQPSSCPDRHLTAFDPRC